MKVMPSVDDRVVARARRAAAPRGSSLDVFVRDSLNEPAREGDTESAVAELDALWDEESWRSCGSWIRDELHERS